MNVPRTVAALMRASRARLHRTRTGRHRLGRPGLTHCRVLPGMAQRIDKRRTRAADAASSAPSRAATRPAARRDAVRPARTFATAAALSAITAVLVSGWYAASGASAIAMMLAR